jgi:predicted nicotinamide N-methyase
VTTELELRLGGFDARLTDVAVGREHIALWHVADLEAHVDRDALLRADRPAEPPYWAHLWSGARLLATAIPTDAGRVVELGCGLGLPSLVAARRGARVLAIDRHVAPLAFVRASARANDVTTLSVAAADFRDLALRAPVDLVLLAEVLYDRAAFPHVVDTLGRLLAPRGEALLADGYRIDTAAFYAGLRAAGFTWVAAEFVAHEDGCATRIRLARITRARR